MDKDKFTKYVSNELANGKDVEIESMLNGIPYKIMFLAIDSDNGIDIPSILAIPLSTTNLYILPFSLSGKYRFSNNSV